MGILKKMLKPQSFPGRFSVISFLTLRTVIYFKKQKQKQKNLCPITEKPKIFKSIPSTKKKKKCTISFDQDPEFQKICIRPTWAGKEIPEC
jgi:hypothetical protein